MTADRNLSECLCLAIRAFETSSSSPNEDSEHRRHDADLLTQSPRPVIHQDQRPAVLTCDNS